MAPGRFRLLASGLLLLVGADRRVLAALELAVAVALHGPVPGPWPLPAPGIATVSVNARLASLRA